LKQYRQKHELKIAINNVVRQSNLKIKKDNKLITRHTIAEEKISNMGIKRFITSNCTLFESMN